MMSSRARRLPPSARGGGEGGGGGGGMSMEVPSPPLAALSPRQKQTQQQQEPHEESPYGAPTTASKNNCNQIKPLRESSIRRIVAEQAISDLASAVKELVDNALDAGGKSINIRLFGQGLDIVEVSDDGQGVPPASRPLLATRYATSKIRSVEELYSGSNCQSMGFRGEALFSLACLSQKLVVATRTADDELATRMQFLRDGRLDPTSVAPMARKVGTTVAVVGLFDALPARRADMARRIRAERQKLFRMLESYAIFCVGVRIQLIDIVQLPNGGTREDVAVATSASSTTLQETVSTVLGHKFLTSLAPLTIDLDALVTPQQQKTDERTRRNATTTTSTSSSYASPSSSSSSTFCITGLISKHPQGTTLPRTICYFCINGRPVELPNVNNVLRKVWQGFGGKKRPSCFLNLRLPNHLFDINLSPDKRQVLLTMEQEICSILSDYMTQFWSSQTNGVFTVQKNKHLLPDEEEPVAAATEEHDYESPEHGAGDSGGEMGERKRHKRRNAFVHDLSKAKMQHEHEHRIVRHTSSPELSPTHPHLDSATTTTTDTPCSPIRKRPSFCEELPDSPPPQAKRSKIVSIELARDEDRAAPEQQLDDAATTSAEPTTTVTSTSVEVSTEEPNSRRADPDRLSDRDRARWTAVQQQFNRRSNDSRDEQLLLSQASDESSMENQQHSSAPVTPDETSTQHATLTTAANAQMTRAPVLNYASRSGKNGNRSSQRQRAPKEQDHDSEEKKQNTFSLSQFAFQPNRDEGRSQTRASRKRNTAEMEPDEAKAQEQSASTARSRLGSTRSTRQKVQQTIDSQQRPKNAKSDSERSSMGSSDSEPEADKIEDNSQHDEDTETKTETDQAMEEDGNEVCLPMDDEESSRPSRSDGNDPSTKITIEVPATSSETVVWQGFQGTDTICHALRTERYHTRRRKRGLQESRKLGTSRSHRGFGDESEASSSEVGESVASIDIAKEEDQQQQSGVLSISKEEFRHDMEVIGQFNLGFILARCRKNHIWILDQHACDEKYNFENYCRTTVMHEQKLLAPMSLELSSAEEACILDHLDIFKANGFDFQFDPEAPIRHRLSLTALPHSGAQDGRKAVQFGKDDVSALCAILMEGSSYDAGDGGTGTDGSGKYGNNAVRRYASTSSQSTQLSQSQVSNTATSSANTPNNDTASKSGPDRILARLPKAIAMFASRACRTSIMIGTALSQKEMEKVVKRLADVEHPWNCPHGRPTMRHVGNVLPLLLNDERNAHDHITGPTMTVAPMTQMTQEEEEVGDDE